MRSKKRFSSPGPWASCNEKCQIRSGASIADAPVHSAHRRLDGGIADMSGHAAVQERHQMRYALELQACTRFHSQCDDRTPTR